MVSVNPLQDLQLTLLPTTTTTSTTTLLTPKLEPKPEPYDDFQFQQPFLSTPTSNPTSQIQDEYNRISDAFRSAFASKTHFPQPSDDDDNASDPDSRALVPVPETQNQSVAVSSPTTPIPNPNKRSSELVRVTDYGANEQRYFREVIRKTRMIYESLRVFAEEEERQSRFWGRAGGGGRVRSDLKSASVMKAKGLWQNRDKRIVGNVPGVQIGDLFVYRMELCVVGLHGTPQAGIDFLPGNCSSNKEPIATSIVVSGGYEDDEDGGDVII